MEYFIGANNIISAELSAELNTIQDLTTRKSNLISGNIQLSSTLNTFKETLVTTYPVDGIHLFSVDNTLQYSESISDQLLTTNSVSALLNINAEATNITANINTQVDVIDGGIISSMSFNGKKLYQDECSYLYDVNINNSDEIKLYGISENISINDINDIHTNKFTTKISTLNINSENDIFIYNCLELNDITVESTNITFENVQIINNLTINNSKLSATVYLTNTAVNNIHTSGVTKLRMFKTVLNSGALNDNLIFLDLNFNNLNTLNNVTIGSNVKINYEIGAYNTVANTGENKFHNIIFSDCYTGGSQFNLNSTYTSGLTLNNMLQTLNVFSSGSAVDITNMGKISIFSSGIINELNNAAGGHVTVLSGGSLTLTSNTR